MNCGRVSCVKFKALDCGHDVEPDERCEYYVNNGLPIPEAQLRKKPVKTENATKKATK